MTSTSPSLMIHQNLALTTCHRVVSGVGHPLTPVMVMREFLDSSGLALVPVGGTMAEMLLTQDQHICASGFGIFVPVVPVPPSC